MKTVIIGLGNPILSDDSVGIKIVRELGHLLSGCCAVECKEIYAGGIRLLDALTGFDRAIIIDAIVTKDNIPGRIHRLTPQDIHTTWNSVSVHDMNFSTAWELGKLLGLQLPAHVDIWGVEGADVESFGESLTEEVARAVPTVINAIVAESELWLENTHSRSLA